MQRSVRLTLIAIGILTTLTVFVWIAVYQEERSGSLTVSFLDVGQGDAIFLELPNGGQVLIDGGASTAVLRRLSDVVPWYDRTIDLMIGTHPDMDHIGGLIDVLPRYRVAMIMLPTVEGDTAAWRTYLREVRIEEKAGANVVIAQRGQRYDLGSGAYLEVLFPDRPVPGIETNTGCIVTRLVYGETAFMFSCDAPINVEKYLVALDGEGLQSDVLKAGHHGSKTSSAPIFVGTVDPQYAVYSRGCDNSYGHPSAATIETFARFNIPTLDTCTEGTITFVSDGQSVARK